MLILDGTNPKDPTLVRTLGSVNFLDFQSFHRCAACCFASTASAPFSKSCPRERALFRNNRWSRTDRGFCSPRERTNNLFHRRCVSNSPMLVNETNRRATAPAQRCRPLAEPRHTFCRRSSSAPTTHRRARGRIVPRLRNDESPTWHETPETQRGIWIARTRRERASSSSVSTHVSFVEKSPVAP